ncbi:dndonuclease I, partial [Kipferlia bialata]
LKMWADYDPIKGTLEGSHSTLINCEHIVPQSFFDKNMLFIKYFINCEHIVPQSFFDKKDPMVSDLHHMRPSYSQANSARNHYPFEVIPDDEVTQWYSQDMISTLQPDESDIDQWSRFRKDGSANSAWEPLPENRGTVARAVLYFYTMYDQFIDEIDKIGDINMFLQWNADHPPSDWDGIRNSNAEYMQGNRNPYVDYPDMCDRAFEDLI